MKIRTDFVTNSSSSSFISFGVLSEELVEFIHEVLGEEDSYEGTMLGLMLIKDGIVNITTTLDDHACYIFAQDYECGECGDHRTEGQIQFDNKLANAPDHLEGIIKTYLPRLTKGHEKRFHSLVYKAHAEENTACFTFIGQTDCFETVMFQKDDFPSVQKAELKARLEAAQSVLKFNRPRSFQINSCTFYLAGFEKEQHKKYAESLQMQGGIIEKDIHATTNCLVVNENAEQIPSAYKKAVAWNWKGKNICIINAAQLEKFLSAVVTPDSAKKKSSKTFSANDLKLVCADRAALTSFQVPGHVKNIGKGAFKGCTSLVNIVIPNSVTSIGQGAFSDCSGLKSIVIPNSVTSIGEAAFRGCSRLEHIIIPDSVTSIGPYAFALCFGLKNIIISRSVTSIQGTFERCTSLTSVVIPDSVTKIEWGAFWGCSSLERIIIPDSVTSIDSWAFKACSADLIIRTTSGSAAHEYAKKYNIKLELIEE